MQSLLSAAACFVSLGLIAFCFCQWTGELPLRIVCFAMAVLTHWFTARGRHWKLTTPVHAEHRPESQRTLFVSVSGRVIDPKNVILDVKHVRD
jgi:hypothetical protein